MLSIVLSATSLYDNLLITYIYCKKRYWLLLAEMNESCFNKKRYWLLLAEMNKSCFNKCFERIVYISPRLLSIEDKPNI